jgi:hypothetical protein
MLTCAWQSAERIARDRAFRASPQFAASAASSDLALSVLNRHVEEFTNTRQNLVGRIDAPHIEQSTLAALDVVGWDRVRI